MSANPNPAYITNEMWWLWENAQFVMVGVTLSGIYANKPGFHNTVSKNLSTWPDNYSVKGPLNLTDPRDKARAIDLTLPDSSMVLYTRRLIDAADARDPRLYGVREFFGTVNLQAVVGRAKDTADGPWRFTSSDSTHLWHIHISIFTKYCNDARAMSGIISVLKGESLADWLGNALPKESTMALLARDADIPATQPPVYYIIADGVVYPCPDVDSLGWMISGRYYNGNNPGPSPLAAMFPNNPAKGDVAPWVTIPSVSIRPFPKAPAGVPGKQGDPGKDGKDLSVGDTLTVTIAKMA